MLADLSHSLQDIRVMLVRYLHIRIIAALACVCLFLKNMGMVNRERSFWQRCTLKCMPPIRSSRSTGNKETGTMCLCVFFSSKRVEVCFGGKKELNHL